MLKKIDAFRWEIPKSGDMRVPGRIYTSERLLKTMGADESSKQVANVAHLPGIVNYSLAMPDVHWGYGFPIGGVAAFDLDQGIVSRAVWATTSTADAALSPRSSPMTRSKSICRNSLLHYFRIFLPVWARRVP
jgi:hypothetical protein